jgi:hypothetical protein
LRLGIGQRGHNLAELDVANHQHVHIAQGRLPSAYTLTLVSTSARGSKTAGP